MLQAAASVAARGIVVYVRSRCKDREPHAQVTCLSHMPMSGVQNPVVFTCWFAAVCHALAPMASISADLRLFCARMSAAEIGLQAIYYVLAFLLGLLGPAIFFMGHDPLHLSNMPSSLSLAVEPYAVSWWDCIWMCSGGYQASFCPL